MKILDPDNYNADDYKINEKVKIKDGDILIDAIITDIDNNNIAIEYLYEKK